MCYELLMHPDVLFWECFTAHAAWKLDFSLPRGNDAAKLTHAISVQIERHLNLQNVWDMLTYLVQQLQDWRDSKT